MRLICLFQENCPLNILILLFYFEASFACPDNYFKCPDSFCIEDRFVCDKKNHCENGEDEQNCGTSNSILSINNFSI